MTQGEFDVSLLRDVRGTGRLQLEALARQAADEIEKLRLVLSRQLCPGWDCPNPECGVFNGDVKERLTHCRSCGTERPS